MALENTVDAWIGLSKSGKGITVKIEKTLYVTPRTQLEKVLSGENQGAKLSKVVGDAPEATE